MNIRQIQEARELYGIDDWGSGFFNINDQGHVVCTPTAQEHLAIPLTDVIAEAKSKGIDAPTILRFPQIIESQLYRMHHAFRDAMSEFKFDGRHRGVFPFKVNQRREFIDSIVSCGHKMNYGLEVGSKTEFIAALGYPLAQDALLVCNGFKDKEFIELSFAATAMGKNVVLVIEGPEELELVVDRARNGGHCPEIGIRSRLYSRGSGKWEKSSGESSKFGLTTLEVLKTLELLHSEKLQDKLAMLHFHIGSQITEIKRIKNAIKEASRVYAKIVKMGFSPRYLNIGGGIGVDYDGSKTSFQSSANYSLQEFANDVVYVIGDVCRNEGVAVPDIVTESGRVIAAYHSVVITDIREVQGPDSLEQHEESKLLAADENSNNKTLQELRYILDNINSKNFVEFYHDAIEYHEELFTLFSLGYVNLKARAVAEHYYHRICRKALYYSTFQSRRLEEFEDLQELMVTKYLANFSIFQSIPDSWSIDQLFPVLPLSRHSEKPTLKAKIVDITCDSDGCLDQFVDSKNVKRALDLHASDGQPYYLGFFLVGAYQESLANEHNLFGAINEAEIKIDDDGSWEITKVTGGDPIDELLECRNYDIEALKVNFLEQLDTAKVNGLLTEEQSVGYFDDLCQTLKNLPYLHP